VNLTPEECRTINPIHPSKKRVTARLYSKVAKQQTKAVSGLRDTTEKNLFGVRCGVVVVLKGFLKIAEDPLAVDNAQQQFQPQHLTKSTWTGQSKETSPQRLPGLPGACLIQKDQGADPVCSRRRL
jgi:hypothetical protein